MTRETEPSIESLKTKEFLKKHWPIAVVAGTTIVGAAIWLTARYIRNKNKRSIAQDRELSLIEEEAVEGKDPSIILLETGSYLGKVAGDEAEQAARTLAEHIESEEVKETLITLSQITKQSKRKS